jgi:hypothetical protein
MGLVLRIGAIFIGILVGFLIYQLLLRPLVLSPLCLIDTEDCLSISYYNVDNTVLVNVDQSDYYIWYDGEKIYLYEPTLGLECAPSIIDSPPAPCSSDKECKIGKYVLGKCIDGSCGCNPNNLPFQPAYEIDISKVTEIPKGYVCIRALQCVRHFYQSKSIKNMLYIKRAGKVDFGVVDLVNELIKRKIIHLK